MKIYSIIFILFLIVYPNEFEAMAQGPPIFDPGTGIDEEPPASISDIFFTILILISGIYLGLKKIEQNS